MKTKTFMLDGNTKIFLKVTSAYVAFGIITMKSFLSIMMKLILDKPFTIGNYDSIYQIGPLWVSIKYKKRRFIMDFANQDVKNRIRNIKTKLYNLLYEIKYNKSSNNLVHIDEQIDNDIDHVIETIINEVIINKEKLC